MGRSPTLVVMALSLAASLVLASLQAVGLDGGWRAAELAWLRQLDFSSLMMQGLLPLLLFAGALQVDVESLRRQAGLVALLAFAGTALSTVLIGVSSFALLHWIGLPLPWLYALLFGALISPTDPVAVLGMLRSATAPRDLQALIAGESLFNDGVGVVIFVLLLGMLGDGGVPTAATATLLLVREAGGGLLLGVVAGALASCTLRHCRQAGLQVLATLAIVMGSYALADRAGMSGPLAVVVIGLVVAARPRDGGAARVRHERFWTLVDEALNAVLFCLVGLQVGAIHFDVAPGRALLAGAAAIVLTLAARWLSAGWPVMLWPRNGALTRGCAGIVTWGGLRGGISLALALALPSGPERDIVVALTGCVVGFALLVQGSTFARFVRASLPGTE